jgi:hypothetical protein
MYIIFIFAVLMEYNIFAVASVFSEKNNKQYEQIW